MTDKKEQFDDCKDTDGSLRRQALYGIVLLLAGMAAVFVVAAKYAQ